jgi:hypothetical protein
MASTISDYVNAARVDLDDPARVTWSDADLQRHVQHAVSEYQLWKPLPVLDTAHTLTAGSRSVDLADITGLDGVLAVEYPAGQWPPAYVQFQLWASTLTLFLDGVPAASDPLGLSIYAYLRHTVNNATCTIDPADDEAITAGTVHFAALEASFFTAAKINAAGPNTWLRYRDLALDKANEFRGYLQNVRARVTPNRLYAPAEPRLSRSTVASPWRD